MKLINKYMKRPEKDTIYLFCSKVLYRTGKIMTIGALTKNEMVSEHIMPIKYIEEETRNVCLPLSSFDPHIVNLIVESLTHNTIDKIVIFEAFSDRLTIIHAKDYAGHAQEAMIQGEQGNFLEIPTFSFDIEERHEMVPGDYPIMNTARYAREQIAKEKVGRFI